MSDTLRPRSLDELRDTVAAAVANSATLEVVGSGSKRGFGRPVQASRLLDLSALAGVRSYEPAELVLTAGAATKLADIEALLAENGQMLGFEPMHLGALLGSDSAGTLGGAIAANLAGPRRVKLGAARDHFLGAVSVSGRGEVFKAGGKVVKNVTGYDLCKLLAGSFGTLAAMEEVTVKVLPAPAKSRTALLFALEPQEAVAVLSQALNSPYEVSGAAYLPAAAAARSGVEYVRKAGTSVVALRLEGTQLSSQSRCKSLCGELSHLAAIDELHTMNSGKLWREIRDVAPLLPDMSKAIWRVSVPPVAGPAIAAAVKGEFILDWGGGLVWLATDATGDVGASAIRAAIRAAGTGHATLVRAPLPVRAAIPVFEPPEPALAALSKRVKEQFDPRGILNPGRMYAGA
jgi:glycolate oxidase FAD binding subunit